MAQQTDIKTLDIVQLKALAYDLQLLLTQTQQNLQIVAQEIKYRQNPDSHKASDKASS